MRLRVFLLGFVAFALLGTTWAFASPVLSNPDESAHSVKAAAAVRGQLVPPKEANPDEGPGSLLRGGFTTSVRVPYSYSWQTSYLPTCYIYDANAAAGCAHDFLGEDDAAQLCAWYDQTGPESCPPKLDDDHLTKWVTLIGRYPPPYYLAVGWPTRIDTGEVGFYTMRLLSAAINAALLALAFACAVAASKLRFMVIGVLVAVTPEALVLAGAVNPNSIEISAAILTWVAAIVAVLDDRPRIPSGVLAALTIGAVSLAWSRALAVLWLAIIAVVVLIAFGDRDRLAARLRERREQVVLGVIAVASVGAVVWTVGADTLGNQSGYEPRGLGLVDSATHSLRLTGSYLRQMVAVFGWQREPSPMWLSIAWGLAILALIVAAVWPSRTGSRPGTTGPNTGTTPGAGVRARWTLLALTVFAVLLPTILQIPTAHEFGFVWSGRYGIAIAAGVPILAATMVSVHGFPLRTLKQLGGSLLAVFTVGQVVAHWANMHRYVVGLDGPVWYFGKDGWTPPLGAPALMLAVAAGAAGLSWLAYRLAVGPQVVEEPDLPVRVPVTS